MSASVSGEYLLKMFGLVEKRGQLGRKEVGQPSLGPLTCVLKGIVSIGCWGPWHSWSCQCGPEWFSRTSGWGSPGTGPLMPLSSVRWGLLLIAGALSGEMKEVTSEAGGWEARWKEHVERGAAF